MKSFLCCSDDKDLRNEIKNTYTFYRKFNINNRLYMRKSTIFWFRKYFNLNNSNFKIYLSQCRINRHYYSSCIQASIDWSCVIIIFVVRMEKLPVSSRPPTKEWILLIWAYILTCKIKDSFYMLEYRLTVSNAKSLYF